ncbi:hypothetical protein G6F65_014669 [Rhizopus arrhizus]|nr:hypothetical protein G6F65_014669 [Rhizopus arrhizus]
MQLITQDRGELVFAGMAGGSRALALREFRRQTQMVFQDSYSSLNPRMTIEDSVAFGPLVHGTPRNDAIAVARGLLGRVGLEPQRFAGRYPHELSGGQRQRVNIARALALHPRLVILDEAVSALDKSVEAQVLNLLLDLKDDFGLTYMFISHDLNVVRYISDRVMVMYLGEVVELGPVDQVFDAPRHPYTQALLRSMPSMEPGQRTESAPLSGDPPNPIDPPSAGARPDAAGRRPCRALPDPSTRFRLRRLRSAGMTSAPQPLVSIRNLEVAFQAGAKTVHALNGVNLEVGRGEAVALIGESGSGKSVTLRALMRLHPPRRTRMRGRMQVDGRDVLAMNSRELAAMRGPVVSMVFQEPLLALDPVYTVGRQIEEMVRRHTGKTAAEARAQALSLFERVRIPSPERRLQAYPHEMSGGMRQRAMIAMALACQPKVLIADEPTTALDVTIQAQILHLLRDIQARLGTAIVLITHDLGVVAQMCQRVIVMRCSGRCPTSATARTTRRGWPNCPASCR